MRFIDRVKTFFRNMATLARPSPELKQALGAILSKVGIHINSKTAVQVTAVFACVRLLAESIASLPLPLYRKTAKGKEKAEDRMLYEVLHDVPNPETDGFQFWQSFIVNMLLYGRGCAEIVRNGAGDVAQLWIIPTPYVKIGRNDRTEELEYVVTTPPPESRQYTLRKDQMFRVDWISMDGLNVFKPLELAQNAIGLSVASEEFASNYFKNGANVGGIIEYPGGLDEEQTERFRQSLRENYSGLSNTARLLFLEQGSKFQKVSNTPEESQMLETRKHQVIEVARFYNVPPHMIMDLERATFSNIEQQSLNFVIYSLRPYLVRIEKAIKAQLLTPKERRYYFAKFNVDALLRGDYKSRMEGHAIARQNGWKSANDIRELEDEDLIPEEEGGNAYLANGNMRSIKELANAPASAVKTTGGENG